MKNKEIPVEKRVTRIREMKYLSQNVFNLKLVAHNGSNFDLPALQDEIMKVVNPSDIKAIRKGSSYFALTIGRLSFLDSMHFAPMKLSKFCSTFEVETPKGVWPYEFYKSDSEIKNSTSFPPITAFYSSLNRDDNDEKNQKEFLELKSNFASETEMCSFFGVETLNQHFDVSPKEFFTAKNDFEQKMASGEWRSMFDMLVHYNMNDCIILHKAMSNFCVKVKEAFNTEVLSRLSLPGLSEG